MKRRERAIMGKPKMLYKDKDKKVILQLLDDLEIQEKIRSIFGGEPHTSNIDTAELQHLQEELKRANEKISGLQQKLEKSDEEISNLRETNTTLQNKCNEAQTEYDEAKTEIDRYQKTYGALEDAFSQFHRLDSNIRNSFQGSAKKSL